MSVRFTKVSGYQIMWVWAMFDLPVTSRKERKRATRFRMDLLDLGFEMVQFSVYNRFSPSKEKAETMANNISKLVPPHGKVDILFFTDRQYELIQSYRGKTESKLAEKPPQLELF